MGEALDTLHIIDEAQLDPRYYTGSLIQQALSCHLLSEKEVSEIQSALFAILAEQCDKQSRGESSSVPVETAQEIMTSILFVIGVKLRQHRIIIVVRLRRQIFRQVVQIERRRADARQAKFVQDDGKDASKRAAKALAVNCAVLP